MFDSLHRSVSPILSLPRRAKQLIAGIVDVCICMLSVWLAFYLRLGEFVYLVGPAAVAAGLSIALALPIFMVSGLYKVVFRYSGWPAMIAVTIAVMIYALLYATVITAVAIPGIPRTIGIIQPLLLFVGVVSVRVGFRYMFGGHFHIKHVANNVPKALIYGAGGAGRLLSGAINQSMQMRVIGYLDDDERLHGHMLNGTPIFAPSEIPQLIQAKGVTHVLLALPSIGRQRRNEILTEIRHYPVAVQTLPNLVDIADGKLTVSDIRDLDVDDLLGRTAVEPNHVLLAKNITDKVVLVTGAGGSIGSELCRQIARLRPSLLLLVESSEYALYKIHSELVAHANHVDQLSEAAIVPLLSSVQDRNRMREILASWRPDTVYHAAAYKHVPIVEHNMAEGVKNNVFGTLTMARLAIDAGVSNFVLISTDKAVRPTNVMGATKRLAEMCVQALYANQPAGSKSKLCMVRFGNVLGSSGSVIPLFRQQIKEGGPITLTHADINRYFMTIPEAAQLVIQAGAMAQGGDVFVLDMGEPVKIIDLAYRIVEMSGLEVRDKANPDGDIEIAITGLRPGEKLYEELLIGDNPLPTQHHRVMKAQDDFMPWDQLIVELQVLQTMVDSNDAQGLANKLQKLVVDFNASPHIVDWLYQQQSRMH